VAQTGSPQEGAASRGRGDPGPRRCGRRVRL